MRQTLAVAITEVSGRRSVAQCVIGQRATPRSRIDLNASSSRRLASAEELQVSWNAADTDQQEQAGAATLSEHLSNAESCAGKTGDFVESRHSHIGFHRDLRLDKHLDVRGRREEFRGQTVKCQPYFRSAALCSSR